MLDKKGYKSAIFFIYKDQNNDFRLLKPNVLQESDDGEPNEIFNQLKSCTCLSLSEMRYLKILAKSILESDKIQIKVYAAFDDYMGEDVLRLKCRFI